MMSVMLEALRSAGSAISLVSFSVLCLTLVSIYRTNISSFARYWYSRNIVKGPSAFIDLLHKRKKQHIVRLGSKDFSITDPALLREIYYDKDFLKSDQYSAFDVEGEATIFSMRDPIEHQQRVKAVRSMFKSSEVQLRQSIIAKQVVGVVNTIKEGIEASKPELDILALMRGYAVQTISSYALGKSYLPGSNALIAGTEFGLVLDDINRSANFGRSRAWLIRKYDSLSSKLKDTSSLLGRQFFWTEKKNDSKDQSAELSLAYRHYAAYCKTISQDLVDNAEYATQLALLPISDAALRAEIADLLFAGTDSTATTLATIFWHVYSSKQLLSALRDDLEYVDDDQLPSRPYLNAVIDEGLRLASPVPRRLPRQVPINKDIFYAEDKHNDDWHKILPAGSTVGVSAYSLHRAPVFKDAELFDPLRWLRANDIEKARMKEHFIPFGRGIRACIGQDLARAEMRYIIRAMVEQFDAVPLSQRPQYDDNFNASIKGSHVLLQFRSRSDDIS